MTNPKILPDLTPAPSTMTLPVDDLTKANPVSNYQQTKRANTTKRLRPGLEARELEEELLLSNRSCDPSRRALAFYLNDMQQRGLHQALGFSSAAHFAYQRLDMSRRRARDFVMVGRALGELTTIDKAFCQGRLSWTKVRLLVPIATNSNEASWLERAESISCHQLEVEIRGAEKGRPPRADGKGTPTVKFHFGAKLPPTAHEIFLQARRKICGEAGAELDDGEVLLALAERTLRSEPANSSTIAASGGSLFQISIGQCSTCAQAHVNTEDGPMAISTEEVEVIRCDAQVLDNGNFNDKAPVTSKSLRRRILARDGGRCTNCTSTSNLHAHHIVFRSDGGKTDAGNLVTLCARCHGMVHDGFLLVSGTAPHGTKTTDRDGRSMKGLPQNSGARITLDIPAGGAQAPLTTPSFSGPRLSELVGQEHIIGSLSVACRAARIDQRLMHHALLCGPPGLGKTTVARAVAAESSAPFVERVGPAIKAIEDLWVPEGTVLFIDEIHGLPRGVAELLYDTMDQKKICIIGATTNPDLMPKPLRDRFAIQEEFMTYNKEELMAVVKGLGPRHRQALKILANKLAPVGRVRLADTMGLDRGVFRNTIEPDLLQLDLVAVTPQGLIAV